MMIWIIMRIIIIIIIIIITIDKAFDLWMHICDRTNENKETQR